MMADDFDHISRSGLEYGVQGALREYYGAKEGLEGFLAT
jgi:hypothetical protein